ncbi:MAG: hypothetical protein ABI091_29325 [Ferruginibacter sp.]
MLQEEEIVKLLTKAFTAKLPEWETLYKKRIARNLQVHTKGLLFSKVDTLFPNENPASKEHCVNTYEPITKGSIWKAINNIVRIFSNSSFTVSASDTTLLNINENNFNQENLFSWFVEKWNNVAVATDPNSLIAIYPPEYLLDKPGAMVRFVENQNIRMVSDDMVVFISEQDSERTYNAQDYAIKSEVFYDQNINSLNSKRIVEKTYNQEIICNITKPTYHVFTKEYFVTFSETDGAFDYTIYNFKKPVSAIPAFCISGSTFKLSIKESFAAPFIPFGNLALLQHRNHRAVDLMFSYPRMSEIETDCDNLNCNDGLVRNGNGEDVTCSVCHGSGKIVPQSPYKTYRKQVLSGISDPDLAKMVLQTDPVAVQTPDTGILDYSKNSWKGYLSMAEEAVFIQQNPETGNIASAKAKQIDKEGEYSWIMNISRALNNDMKKTIQAIENYINPNPVLVTIEQPISFALVTETEAFGALDAIINSEAPIFVKAQQVENFVHKFVSKSSPLVKALKILKAVDPLLFYSTKDLQTYKSNNVITVDAWTVHVFAYAVLMQQYEMDKYIFEKEEKAIIDLVLSEIEKLKPSAATLKDNLLKVA